MKKPIYIILIAIIMILALLLLVRGEKPAEEPQPPLPPSSGEEQRHPLLAEAESTQAVVYYTTASGVELVPVTHTISATKEVAKEALIMLLAGAPAEPYADSVPAGTKLLSLYTIYQTVYVDLSKEFLSIPDEQMQLAVDAICATVLPLTDGFWLQILVEGQGYASINGVALDKPLSRPYLNADPLPEGLDLEDAFAQTYYQPDLQGRYFVPRTLFLAAEGIRAESRAEAIVEMLLPQGVARTDLRIEDKQLLLELEITGTYAVSPAYEAALLEALVRSLTGIGGIESVALLQNGQALTSLPQGTPCAAPLFYNTAVNVYD